MDDTTNKATRALGKVAAATVGGLATGGPLGGAVAAATQTATELLDLFGDRQRLQGFLEARLDLIRHDVEANVARLASLLVEQQALGEARAAAAPTWEELAVLFGQLHEQAMRAVTEERRRVLCAAMAGAFRPDVETEMKARAVRALAQVEASDVVWLRDFQVHIGAPGAHTLLPYDIHYRALERVDCLKAAPNLTGWSDDEAPAPRDTGISEVGRAVLKLLETYEPPLR